jgi:flagellar hook-associated protein 3 FlgL
VSIRVNTLGSDALGAGQNAGDPGVGDDKLLDVLRDIADDLRGGNGDALRTTDLRRLDANLEEISRQRATVGATPNRLGIAGSRLAELEGSAQRLLPETEDADMAKAMVDYSMRQSVYRAALKSGANLVQASLLDFLR